MIEASKCPLRSFFVVLCCVLEGMSAVHKSDTSSSNAMTPLSITVDLPRPSPPPPLPHRRTRYERYAGEQVRCQFGVVYKQDNLTNETTETFGGQDIPKIMSLVDSELSEPYNYYTYRYFLADWSVVIY